MELSVTIPDLYIGIGIGLVLAIIAWVATFIYSFAHATH